MKIKQIAIHNFRLLKNFTIDLEDDLTLVIGKNNCAKTSFLSLLERFLIADQNIFSFEDFNLDCHQELIKRIEQQEITEDFNFGLELKLYIHYDKKDNLKNISDVMLNLNPKENVIVLSFNYAINYENLLKLKDNYSNFKIENTEEKKDIIFYLKKNHKDYFKIHRRALEFNNETNFIEIPDKNIIKNILNFKRIKAKRDVSDIEGDKRSSDKKLSKMSSLYYDKVSINDDTKENTKGLQEQLSKTDEKLDKVYEALFKNVIKKVKRFGGVKENESIIKIISTLEEKNILKENTTVTYEHGEHSLPEDYNGLGYLNLIAMIFEIEVILNDFKKKNLTHEEPSDINLLFIEEPEAHTHPQMQYVFIKNIKNLLEEECKGKYDSTNINLQTIISTHSAHITAESDFNDIKYFYREDINEVISKNLSELESIYGPEDEAKKQFQFLKQYLTLNRAELFFADKAIFIEGDTERILLPAIMKKIDKENNDDTNLPLLSQNISIIETGAYSKVFEKFIHFLGIKTLIITDLDTIDDKRKKCEVVNGNDTSNSSLKFFFREKTLTELKGLTINEKVFSKIEQGDELKWIPNKDGNLCIVFQTEENQYHARSFEDAFISLNLDFIMTNKDKFESLKNEEFLNSNEFYKIADNCITKKTLFALDVLYHSDEKFSNWKIPAYIREGLSWLKKELK